MLRDEVYHTAAQATEWLVNETKFQIEVNPMKRRVFFPCILFLTAATTMLADVAPAGPDRLMKEVRHELVMLPYYGVFDNLAYRVDGTNVTLLGQVTKPTLKSDAEAAVKAIEGIGLVDNQIEVLPVSRNDDKARLTAYREIYSKGPLQRYQLIAVPPIHIIVKNGNLVLEGIVASENDKTLAEVAVRGVHGVFSTENRLRVEVPQTK